MTMDLEVRRYRLKTLSPLFIGSGEKLTALEYVFLSRKLFVLDEEKLSETLSKMKCLTDFVNFVKSGGSSPGRRGSSLLADFLSRYNLLNREFVEKVKRYSINYDRINCDRFQAEVWTSIKDSLNRVYIPGSSIKGALRTGVMYYLLKNSPEKTRSFQSFVKEKLSFLRRKYGRRIPYQERKTFAKNFETELFQHFKVSDAHRKFDPHTDIMRVVKVSDSGVKHISTLEVDEVKIFSWKSGTKPFSIYIEAIKPGTEFDFTVTIDHGLWKQFKKHKITPKGISLELVEDALKDPFKCAAVMAEDLFNYEKKFSQQLHVPYKLSVEDTPNLRIGWGNGLLGITVDLLLPEELRKDLRNTIFSYRGNTPAPKSRRFSVIQNSYVPIGWVKVTRV